MLKDNYENTNKKIINSFSSLVVKCEQTLHLVLKPLLPLSISK